MMAEDNVINQKVAQGMLEKVGVRVDLACNGQEAIDTLGQLPYDLVLMDCLMPVLDGYEATRWIRDPQSRVKDHTISVIAMTANAMQGDRERCIAAGMDDHIAKPVDPMKLRLVLEQWLPSRCLGAVAQGSATVQESSGRASAQTEGLPAPAEPVFDHAGMSLRLTFGSDFITVVLIRDAALFDPERLEAIQATVKRLEVLPFVLRTQSLFSVPYLRVVDDFVHTDPFLEVRNPG